MTDNKNYKTLKSFLVSLGFEHEKNFDIYEIWSHPKKSINYQTYSHFNKINSLKKSTREFLKLIKENFSQDELQNFLKPFLKKNKINFYVRNKEKILRMETYKEKEFETFLLGELLPEKTKSTYFDYSTPIEFSKKLKKCVQNKFVSSIDEEIKKSINISKKI